MTKLIFGILDVTLLLLGIAYFFTVMSNAYGNEITGLCMLIFVAFTTVWLYCADREIRRENRRLDRLEKAKKGIVIDADQRFRKTAKDT